MDLSFKIKTGLLQLASLQGDVFESEAQQQRYLQQFIQVLYTLLSYVERNSVTHKLGFRTNHQLML